MWCRLLQVYLHVLNVKIAYIEGLLGVLGNKGTKRKYRREQGNVTLVLGNKGT